MLPDPQPQKSAIQRIELTPYVTITLNMIAEGVCGIVLEGPLMQDTVLALHQVVLAQCTQAQCYGLLVDVQQSPTVSLVRLAGLLEMLSEFRVPVAVLLHSESQRQLAGLLHNTLTHTDGVAYFTSRDAALNYVRDTAAAPNANLQ